MDLQIAIQPIGPVERGILEFLTSALPKAIPVSSLILNDPMTLPDSVYDPQRRQHRSDPILRALAKRSRLKFGGAMLGIADLDAYVDGLNFVLGQAVIGGGAAVIYLPRLRQEFYGGAKNRDLFYERALKEAVHELGHTVGLRHCSDPRCVMHFSNSIADTDFKGWRFCDSCSSLVGRPSTASSKTERLR